MKTFLASLALLGCSACATTYVSAPERVHPSLGKMTPAQLQRHFERESKPAHNLRLYASLWDTALVENERVPLGTSAATSTLVEEPTQERENRMARWHEQFLKEQTTFTVVIELANRPPMRKGRDDRLTDLSQWRFSLKERGGKEQAPSKIEVQSIDRFPTRAGGWHWRMAATVHFAESPRTRSAEHPNGMDLVLRIRPPKNAGWRGEHGRLAPHRGFALHWWIASEQSA